LPATEKARGIGVLEASKDPDRVEHEDNKSKIFSLILILNVTQKSSSSSYSRYWPTIYRVFIPAHLDSNQN
jgi:hypothetical protein